MGARDEMGRITSELVPNGLVWAELSTLQQSCSPRPPTFLFLSSTRLITSHIRIVNSSSVAFGAYPSSQLPSRARAQAQVPLDSLYSLVPPSLVSNRPNSTALELQRWAIGRRSEAFLAMPACRYSRLFRTSTSTDLLLRTQLSLPLIDFVLRGPLAFRAR